MDELGTRAGKYTGTIDELIELLKFFCLAQINHAIKVESGEGVGTIQVRSGQICHAEIDNARGESAFYVMMQWKEGRFETMSLKADEPQSIENPWELLIHRAMHLREAKVRKAEGQKEELVSEPLFKKVQRMKFVDRIKLALAGDKEARSLLIRDSNRMVQVAVTVNPRLTEGEIASFANSRMIDEEVLRRIGISREWTKNYPVRLGLVKNPKTPLAISLRLVPTLLSQDLKILAKSKGVPTAVVNAAKRLTAHKD